MASPSSQNLRDQVIALRDEIATWPGTRPTIEWSNSGRFLLTIHVGERLFAMEQLEGDFGVDEVDPSIPFDTGYSKVLHSFQDARSSLIDLIRPAVAGDGSLTADEFLQAVQPAMERLLEGAKKLASRSPVAAFTTSPLWAEAQWSSTTFQWHPTSEAPPIMGIVFENADKGKELFSTFAKTCNHSDRFEELRISIIEGSPDGQRPGYSVHLGPEMEMLQAMATAEDIEITTATMPFFGQVNRMYPIPGQPNLLARFKQEYEKHKQFLLAPVVKRADGQLWCEHMLGIEKSLITFRA